MKFRPDLEGLRGAAVVLVVLFHAGLGVKGGFVGVDVFYVLSGYLITGLLLREVVTTGGMDLAAFYVRRARRILPAATTTIVVVLAAASILVAPLDLAAVTIDATASALFSANVLFALRATDYFASSAPSPFLHYWSLGVEEQFYLAWPLFLLIACRVRQLHRLTLTVCVASLAFGIALTAVMPPWAFYGLPTRAWELALGALLAIHAPRIQSVRSLPIALAGWLGLALLVVAALALDRTFGYPGYAALLPTLAVALLICAGDRRGGPGLLLRIPPLRWLGRISFSLYLYHWPVLVFAWLGTRDLPLAQRWGAVAFSIVLATLSWKLVEEPFLRGRWSFGARRSFALAGSALAVVIVVAQLIAGSAASFVAASSDGATVESIQRTLPLSEPATGPDALEAVVPAHTAASEAPAPATPTATVAPTAPPAPRELMPRIADARGDGDGLEQGKCGLSLAGSAPPRCELGAIEGTVTVALIGDSHAAQWFPALDAIARQRGWRILPFTKDSCIFLDMRIVSLHLEREYTECARWRENVVKAVQGARPDLVVVSSSRWVHPVLAADADAGRQADAMARLLRQLRTRVAVIADTPLQMHDVPACLSRRDRTADACATPRGYALTRHLERDEPAARAADAALIDPSPWLCGTEACPAVIDRTITYRDDHHLTATMARRLAPLLEPGLLDALALAPPGDPQRVQP